MKIVIRMISPNTGRLEYYRGEVESKRQLRACCDLFRLGRYTGIEVSPDVEPYQWRAVRA